MSKHHTCHPKDTLAKTVKQTKIRKYARKDMQDDKEKLCSIKISNKGETINETIF